MRAIVAALVVLLMSCAWMLAQPAQRTIGDDIELHKEMFIAAGGSLLIQPMPISDVLACIGSRENATIVTAAYAFIRTRFPQGSASELEALQLDLQSTVAGKVRQYRDQRAAEVQELDAIMTPSERQAIQEILEAAKKRRDR